MAANTSTIALGVVSMVKLKPTYYIFLKTFIALGLFIAFIFTSAEPSIVNYNRHKVMTDVSKSKQEAIMTPAVTVCINMVT